MSQQQLQTVLIVEDDADIRRLVAGLLSRENFEVEEAEDGVAMDAVLSRVRPDIIILDLMLPGEDGLSICRRLQGHGIPVIMLTAKSDEIDRVLGLEMGADDYVVKPFGPRELIARVRTVLRRGHPPAPLAPPSRRFAFAGLTLDVDARRLTAADGASIALTTAEFDLLTALVEHPRRVLSRDQILGRIFGRTAEPYDRTVDVLVSRLRKKLSAVTPDMALVTTVRNGGYLFTETVRRVP